MAMQERPQVRETIGGKCWEHAFKDFYLKASLIYAYQSRRNIVDDRMVQQVVDSEV